jgi:hypothetical protein
MSFIVELKKDWDFTPDIINMKNYNAYVQNTRACQLLIDLFCRGTKGAFLLSGRRGVGKTTQVVYAIRHAADKLVMDEGIEVLPVRVDASNFEIFYRNSEEGKNAEPDLSKIKYSILQNLSLELAQNIHDNLLKENEKLRKNRDLRLLFNKMFNKFEITTPTKNIKDRDMSNQDLSDLLTRTTDLLNKAKAKRINSETQFQSLLQDRLSISKEFTINLQTASKFSFASIPFIGAGIALALNPLLSNPLSSILAVLVGAIPPLAIAISWNLKKAKSSVSERGQRTLTNLTYEYDANAIQDDLEKVLTILTKISYKVIFVVDNLDEVNETFMASLARVQNLLINTHFVYFIFVGDEGYYKFMVNRRENRSKESNLFTQNIFFQDLLSKK